MIEERTEDEKAAIVAQVHELYPQLVLARILHVADISSNSPISHPR